VCWLRWLDLGSNDIGEAGTEKLADSLGPHTPLTRLILRNNQVGPNKGR
jgi:Ran GTPase-activating protein (RanGAP) involved in mRNA processing and transport